jgi:hypothetical protein
MPADSPCRIDLENHPVQADQSGPRGLGRVLLLGSLIHTSMRRAPWRVHITVRRASSAAQYRLWAEVDADFGVVLARSDTLAGLRRNAARAILSQWRLGQLENAPGHGGAKAPPEIRWHRSTRRYARLAGRDISEIRRRMRESERKIRKVEARLRRAGAYAREARVIAQGQVYIEVDLARSMRSGRLEVVPWSP